MPLRDRPCHRSGAGFTTFQLEVQDVSSVMTSVENKPIALSQSHPHQLLTCG